jgi:hypothetical protein
MKLLRSCSGFLYWLMVSKVAKIVRALSVGSKMKGHIIARVFPAVKTNKHQQSHSSRNPKPQHAIIDPCLLKPESGHLKYRPDRATVVRSSPWSDSLDTHGNTTLDVYLYPQTETEDSVHFTMNRDSKELLSKTLDRLEISLAKKLNQTESSALSLKSNKHREHSRSSPSPSSAPPIMLTINPETSQPLETWDTSTLANGEWIKQSLESPCMLQIHEQTDDGCSTRQLLVEACPPTITGVQTFEEFESCLFVGIPIRVNVEIQFADGCFVDWFARSLHPMKTLLMRPWQCF